ncbi:outer membrane protein [Sphingomonas sp. ERG5]|uniref:outer membrane protein n=1 Tax=Sphingomonas sp. ERG5 TaxID=1381597 RepID=UPI000A797F6F|nr:outer membrane beta-barrel protein [Sphingomonas sp. ERG5]
MKKTFPLLVVAALALPIAAQAQDRSAQGASRTQGEPSPFAGTHATVEIGRNDTKVRQDGAPASKPFEHKAGLAKLRGAVGYDAALGSNFLVGAEAGIGTGGRSFKQRSLAGGTYRFRPGLTYDLTARAGVMPVKNLLIYGRGGYRWMRSKEEITGQTTGNGVYKQTDGGWTYGAGVELALSSSFSLRGEYNRTNFDKNLRQNRLSLGGSFRF